MAVKPVGINFHEGLQLTRSRLASVLRFFRDHPEGTREELRRETDLGANMVVAFPNLAVGCGFLVEGDTRGGKVLTPLGAIVAENDPYLQETASQWLIHFGMSDPSGRGPQFWKTTVLDIMRIGSWFSVADVVPTLAANERVVQDKVYLAVSKLVESYLNHSFLGELGLIEKTAGMYAATVPSSQPPLGVFAYAVARRWDALHQGQLTTSLDTFLDSSRLLDVFRLSRAGGEELLEGMRRRGDIELYRSAPPHQIVRHWSEVSEEMALVYDHNL